MWINGSWKWTYLFLNSIKWISDGNCDFPLLIKLQPLLKFQCTGWLFVSFFFYCTYEIKTEAKLFSRSSLSEFQMPGNQANIFDSIIYSWRQRPWRNEWADHITSRIQPKFSCGGQPGRHIARVVFHIHSARTHSLGR